MRSREAKRVVYMIGPIRSIKEKKVWGWREAARRRLQESFDCRNFPKGREEWAPQEIEFVQACDIVLANMWKPSIGTTLGIVRARQSGRLVVLLLGKQVRSPMLESLVGRGNVVGSLAEACERVAHLGRQLDRIIIEPDGTPPAPVQTRELARLVSQAAGAGKEEDFALEAIVLDELMSRLSPSHDDVIEWRWADVEQQLREAVAQLVEDTRTKSDLHKRLRAVSKALRDTRLKGSSQGTYLGAIAEARASRRLKRPEISPAPPGSDQVARVRVRAKELKRPHQVIQLLLPNLILVRQSYETILERLRDPAGVIELLRELSSNRRPPQGERFEGTEWIELRASTGNGSGGRIYYHQADRLTLVLVSLKDMQKRDKEWLQRSSNWSHLVKG